MKKTFFVFIPFGVISAYKQAKGKRYSVGSWIHIHRSLITRMVIGPQYVHS